MYLKSVSWIVISTAIFGLNLIITEYLKKYQNLGYLLGKNGFLSIFSMYFSFTLMPILPI